MTLDPEPEARTREAMRDPEAEPPQFTMHAWISCAPFEQLCELEIVRADGGTAVLRMPFKVKFAQGGGLLHGGALTTLADTAVAMAIKSRVPEGTRFATVDLTTRFLAPVRCGTVEARAWVSSWEGRDIEGAARVIDAAGQTVAEFTSRFRLAREDVERLHTKPQEE